MSAVEHLLCWPKDQYNGSGAPKIARTKKHTTWAKKNDVRRSDYMHWGGKVYAFWRFGSEGALMAFVLEDDLRLALVDDGVDKWCAMGAASAERARFLADIKHDFADPIYHRLAYRIAEASKTTMVGNFITAPWEVTAANLTAAFGQQADRITITESEGPNGSIVKSTRVKGKLDY